MNFRRGFVVGLGITLVSSALYLGMFQLLCYELRPGIGETYAEYMVERARRSGASDARIAETTQRAHRGAELYQNPWSKVALTLLEPLPMGLVLEALSAVRSHKT